MIKATRTVVVPSVRLTEKKLEVFRELEDLYRQVLVELVNYGFRSNIDSFVRLKKDKYHELRGKIPTSTKPLYSYCMSRRFYKN